MRAEYTLAVVVIGELLLATILLALRGSLLAQSEVLPVTRRTIVGSGWNAEIHLQSFDPNQQLMRGWIVAWFDNMEVPPHGTTFWLVGNTVPPLRIPITEDGMSGTLRAAATDPTPFTIRLHGDPSMFPFEDYSGDLLFGIETPYGDLPRFPDSIEVHREFGGFRMAFPDSESSAPVVLSRPVFEKGIFILATIILGSLLAGLVTLAFHIDDREILQLLIGAASLAVAVPVAKSIFVPDIQSRTLFDLLLIPFLGGVFFTLCVAAGRFIVHLKT